MKTLNTKIILYALLSILFLAPLKAQEKTEGPSIEETVEYINKIVSVSLGAIPSRGETRNIIDKQYFSLENIKVEEKFYYGVNERCISTTIFNYENISWETFDLIKEKQEGSLIKIVITFKLPFNYSWLDEGNCSKDPLRKGRITSLSIYVLPDKAENVKKALLHLKKLMYKEDPFGN